MKIIQAPDTSKDSISFEDLPLIAAIRHMQISLKTKQIILSHGLPSQLDTLRRDSPTIEWFDFLEQKINRLVVKFYPRNLDRPIKEWWSGIEVYCMTHRILKQGQPHQLPEKQMGSSRAGQLYFENGLRAECSSPQFSGCTGHKGLCEVDHIVPKKLRKGVSGVFKEDNGFKVHDRSNLQLLCAACNGFKTNKFTDPMECVHD